MTASVPFSIMVVIVLVVLAACFSAVETAVFSLSRIDRNRIQKSHPRLSKWVMFHLERPRQALISILIGNLVVQTLSASLFMMVMLELLGPQGASIAVVFFTILFILFGEIIPKIIAVRKNEIVSLAAAVPLRIFSVMIFPVRRLTRILADWILSLLMKEKIESVDTISEDELKAMVKIGEEEGILDRDECKMIQKIFDLGEHQVKDIMTPRIEVRGLDVEDPRSKHEELIRQHHHAKFPVCKGSLDNILGVISVQDYMLNKGQDIQSMLREPLFVPGSKRVDDLLAEFRTTKHNFAVCVDEFGGTAGIVTLEDILEEVFGEFYDEYEKVENPIRPCGFNEYLIEAKIPLTELNERFALHLEAEEATTLAGFILEKMGKVPEKGKVLSLPECEIRIHEVIRQRLIRHVVVRLLS